MKVTKTVLVDEISESTNLSKKDVTAVITAFTKTVIEHLEVGDEVSIPTLGRFVRKVSKARKFYSIRARDVVYSSTGYRLKFYPSIRVVQILKSQKVSEEDVQSE